MKLQNTILNLLRHEKRDSTYSNSKEIAKNVHITKDRNAVLNQMPVKEGRNKGTWHSLRKHKKLNVYETMRVLFGSAQEYN